MSFIGFLATTELPKRTDRERERERQKKDKLRENMSTLRTQAQQWNNSVNLSL